jgi:hypothetical protein
MNRHVVAVVSVVALLVAVRPAHAEDTRSWTSPATYSGTSVWWGLQLEERFGIGGAESALYSSTGAVTAGIGLGAVLHLDHHWLVAAVFALDFSASAPDVAPAYAAVGTEVAPLDIDVVARLGYLPLALSWLTLGVVAEVGLVIDSTSVTSGGQEASGTALLGSVGGMVELGLFPHDAFEIGVRVGYRYLLGDRATLSQADADRLHVPRGPYRDLGDVAIMVYEALHF